MKNYPIAHRIYRGYLKRILDVLGGVLLLILIWPFLVLVAFVLALTIGGPVIFRQTRPGFKGKPFTIYKFRTMTDERDTTGGLLPDEQRITTVGRIMRSFSLDELPEILNVLKGDMSFVGPRPLLMQYLERYTPEQARRNEVKPGITGLVQVSGRNTLTWEEKFLLDVWYVHHQSFFLDLQILAKTLWKVLKREGISHDGHVGAPEFMGSMREKTAWHQQHSNTSRLVGGSSQTPPKVQ